MFRIERRQEFVKARPTDESGIYVERTSLVRDDGVRLEDIGSGPEGDYHFRYTDADISFELRATLYDSNHQPTDTWVVGLGPALANYSPSRTGPVNVQKARAVAANIAEALMAWPPLRGSAPPIRHVKFLMKFWPLWDLSCGDWL